MPDTATAARYRELARSGQPYLLRANARITLSEAAGILGVNCGTLIRWEHGDSEPSAANMERYVAWLEELTVRNGGPVILASCDTGRG